jgi:hypothetical protein
VIEDGAGRHQGTRREGGFSVAAGKIGTRQIREALQESYPDLRNRAARLVELVQQERAAHALLPRPNEADALADYEQKEEFLKTMEAGIVSFHEDLPETPDTEISEENAKKLRSRLVDLARLADATVRYLDSDTGTYGGLYKIGLIASIAGILALIPGVTWATGTILPSAVLGAQTIRLRIKKGD